MELQSNAPLVHPRYGRTMVIIAAVGLAVWLAELAYQYYVLAPGVLANAFIAGSGLAGAKLIAVSLLMSVVFKCWPKLVVYWRYRRYMGVAGFAFVCVHIGYVLWYGYGMDWSLVFFSWNPFENAAIFGVFAFIILFVMAVTSSDVVQRKLGKWWKFIHRFVYIAYLTIIFHALRMNPRLIDNLAGKVLVGLSVLAIVGQVYWWARVSAQRRFKNVGFYVGFSIIILAAVLVYIVTCYYGGLVGGPVS